MDVIDKNVKFLNDFDVMSEVLIHTTQSSDENYRFWNLLLVVHEKTGEFLKLSADAYYCHDTFMVTIKAKVPLDSESPKLMYELVGLLEGELPTEVELVINTSFTQFNEQDS